MPKNQLLDQLFSLFREKPHWPIKVLREKTQQPELYLKETLLEIATLHRSGEHTGMWELSANFKGDGVGGFFLAFIVLADVFCRSRAKVPVRLESVLRETSTWKAPRMTMRRRMMTWRRSHDALRDIGYLYVRIMCIITMYLFLWPSEFYNTDIPSDYTAVTPSALLLDSTQMSSRSLCCLITFPVSPSPLAKPSRPPQASVP